MKLPYALLIVVVTVLPVQAAETIPTFLLMGQSNAGGGAWPPYPSGELADPQPSLYNYWINPLTPEYSHESPEWENVRSLWPNPSLSSFGVEITFAHTMQERLGQPIALIKVAQNAAGLDVNWRPAAENLYPVALEKIQSSLAGLDALGYTPQLSGVLWIQGENDSNIEEWANQYHENLQALAQQLRADLNAPDLRWGLNLLHTGVSQYHNSHGYTGWVETIRQQQQDFVVEDPYALAFDPSDLAQASDYLHYTHESFLELGVRFADLFAPLPSGDFNKDGLIDEVDLGLWTEGLGDGDHDGDSDGADFLLWQCQMKPAVQVAIPEPSSALLLAMAAGYCFILSRSLFW